MAAAITIARWRRCRRVRSRSASGSIAPGSNPSIRSRTTCAWTWRSPSRVPGKGQSASPRRRARELLQQPVAQLADRLAPTRDLVDDQEHAEAGRDANLGKRHQQLAAGDHVLAK